MQQRMLKNVAFFSDNKISQILQIASSGANRKYNLYFSQDEINIIDLSAKKFLYPKGAFLNVAQNIAQTPLNNDKWRIYANNLKLSKIAKNSNGSYGVANLNITAEAVNKIVDITHNSFLCSHSADLANFEHSQTPSLVSCSKFAKNYKSTTAIPSVVLNALDSSLRGEAKAIQNNPCVSTQNSPNLWCEKLESKDAEVRSADFLLEAKKRGSPPKSKKQQLLGNTLNIAGGSGEGVQPFYKKEKSDLNKQSGESITKLTHPISPLSAREGESLDCLDLQSKSRNDKSADSTLKDNTQFAYHLPPFFLPQTNIFGLCGGLFLGILLEMGYFFHSLLIYEEEAELFALSCYFIDYELLFSRVSPKSCYIFIENLLNKGLLNHYFYSKKITNNFLRLELNLLKSPKTETFKNLTFETYRANARGWGNFEDEMIGLKNTFANVKNAPFLRLDKKLKTPICVVGSGPSLEANIDFIRANQGKMLIFSCGTALKVLRAHNIAIDFQIEIERVPYLAQVLQDSNLGDTATLCASLVNTQVLEISQDCLLFMRGGSASSYIFDKIAPKITPLEFCAPFVGNAGFSLACALGEEVIMCGMDCGFIKGFAKHASGSIYGNERAEIPADSFRVDGNCDEFEVFSNAIFSLSKESFALAITHYKPKSVYNLSFGAKIRGANFAKNLSLKSAKNAKITNLNRFMVDESTLDLAKKTLQKEAILFIDMLKNTINCEASRVSTKQELFIFIDFMSEFLAKISVENPKIGILLEGSISHLLQSAMIAMLTIKSNDIKTPFSKCKEAILNAIESYKTQIKGI